MVKFTLFTFTCLELAVIFFQLFREYLDVEMSKTRSEDVLGEKWDRCLADTSVKILGGKLDKFEAPLQTLYMFH